MRFGSTLKPILLDVRGIDVAVDRLVDMGVDELVDSSIEISEGWELVLILGDNKVERLIEVDGCDDILSSWMSWPYVEALMNALLNTFLC